MKHTLVVVKGLEQAAIKLTVQRYGQLYILKKSVDVQEFRITHMATCVFHNTV